MIGGRRAASWKRIQQTIIIKVIFIIMILIEIYGTTGVNARFISLLIVQILLKYIDFPDKYQYLGQSHFILS